MTDANAGDADPKWVQLDDAGTLQDFTFDEAAT